MSYLFFWGGVCPGKTERERKHEETTAKPAASLLGGGDSERVDIGQQDWFRVWAFGVGDSSCDALCHTQTLKLKFYILNLATSQNCSKPNENFEGLVFRVQVLEGE